MGKEDKKYEEYVYNDAQRRGMGILAPSRNPRSKEKNNEFSGLSYDPNKTYAPSRKYTGAQGISALGEWNANTGRDWSRDLANFGSTLLSWLTSTKEPGAGSGYGDYLFGSNPEDLVPQTKTSSGRGSLVVPDRVDNEKPDDKGVQPDAYDAAMAFLSGQSAQNQARIQAMYRELADYIVGQAGANNATYDTAATDYQNANTAASNAVNAGYDMARQQQAGVAERLGIQDAFNTILERGQDMAVPQTAATTRLAEILNSNLNRNTASKALGAQNLLTTAQAAAGEGARTGAQLAQRTQGELMNLLLQQQNARQNSEAAQLDAQMKAAEIAARYPAAPTAQQISDTTSSLYQNAVKSGIPADEIQKWVEMQLRALS